MKCSRCGSPRPRANLTSVGDELVCPECLYAVAAKAWSSQKLATTPEASDQGVERQGEETKTLRPRGRPPGKRPKATTDPSLPLMPPSPSPE
jgi:DNA-directed RNA polymerase subunit RPC12/RpoP